MQFVVNLPSLAESLQQANVQTYASIVPAIATDATTAVPPSADVNSVVAASVVITVAAATKTHRQTIIVSLLIGLSRPKSRCFEVNHSHTVHKA